ncbi:MAG: hypothetical protein HN742_17775 [Lentisphaerae bacterium]|jgi:hypothetical protein|nr:hypothetical protein [Lentisphaerota bacterium]MBT4818804.1 hypothetical protein [Lentisphaerota bacterium]MBT5613004.1 hypothetical protein [Lentisphaerota bacterium]MBT7056750.1 hypothetical protein [Lentisphaerota bacterium]MBT7843732.1 hypothetical protein [Lentisphaerota bacterium]
MTEQPDNESRTAFEDAASDPSFLTELWEFLLENRKFWLVPILIVLLMLGVLIVMSNPAVAPFIYRLF